MRVLDKEQSYQNAKKKVEAIKGFYWHLFASIFIIPFLCVVNYITTDYPWVLFPIAGIVLSIIIHWFSVFKSDAILGKSWEERKIKELMEKEESGQRKLYK